MEIKKTESLKAIENYFININDNFLSKGNFIIDHFFYLMDDIYNYQKENNNLDNKGNVLLLKRVIDDHFMVVYNSIKDLIRKKNNPNIDINNKFKKFILSNKDKIHYIIRRYKNVIAERIAEMQYNEFISNCSNFLEFYEKKTKKPIRNKIKSLLKILFSYDNKKYDKKLEARHELRNILHKLKKEFKKINGKNTKNSKEIKAFSMWKVILQEFLEDKIENAIDKYRTRYLKNNNMKYFRTNETYSGMVQTNIISDMSFLRGICMPEYLYEEEMKKELKAVDEKIKRVGKDKPIIEFYKVEKETIIEKYLDMKKRTFYQELDNCLKNGMDSLKTNFVAINNQYSIDCSRVHEGLLSATTNLDIANKYSIGEKNEYKNEYPVIFLINPSIETEILHPTLGDQRAFAYSEVDFTAIPPESIVGYFEVKNHNGELRYIFHKNIYITSNILKNKYNFIDKNGNKNELKNDKIYTKKDIENILMNSNKELKEMQKYYLLKSIEIAKYLLKIKDNPIDYSENLYNNVMKLFKGNEVQIYIILKKLSQLKKGDIDEILNTKTFYKEYWSKSDIFYCDIINPFCNTTNCRFYPIANIYNYLKSNDKLKYINEEVEEGTAEWIDKRLNLLNTNVSLELKANKGEFNKDNIYYETNNWVNLVNEESGKTEWFYKNIDKPLTKRKTKINISIDPEPENCLKAKIVFRRFLDKYNLYGKMPPENENNRNVLIIYNQLTEEQLSELEENLKEAEVRPKLLSCSEYTCDIAIKNSLYLYFKCDGFKYYDKNDKKNKEAYRNIQQVEYMDKIRQGIYDNDKDTSIRTYRNYINSTKNDFSKDNYFKNYSNDYFEYLEIIRKCNAVQRQLIDMIFRVELMAEKGEEDGNGKKLWNKELFKYLTVDFIGTRLNLVKAFVEKTKDIDEIELRNLLNNLIKGTDENYEPKLEKECIEYVNSIKESLKNKEEKSNDIQFNNKLKNANDNINEKLNEKIEKILNEVINS